MKRICVLVGSVLWSSFSSAGTAQIVPDTSLPRSSVVSPGCVDCIISGGTQAGRNLFHSFEQFSVPVRGRAYFNNSAQIHNVFARVTGKLPSNINGEIRTNGSANLFLLNPNGIIFGRNASLNIGGSFYAATGNNIRFQDGFEFSANPSSTSPLLTVSVPVGVQFGQDPGPIVNRSQSDRNGLVNTRGEPVGLQVGTGENLVLLGRGVRLDNGNMTARSGRISIIGIAPLSQVELVSHVTDGFTPTYGNALNLSDIWLKNSQIDTSGSENSSVPPTEQSGGSIQIFGRNILMRDQSIVTSSSRASMGGDLRIFGSDSISLSNQSSLDTFAENAGNAGNVFVHARESLVLTGISSIASQTRRNSSGNAGNLSIRTGSLVVRGGSAIEASTFGEGRGGNIKVQATAIEIAGFNQRRFTDFNGTVKKLGEAPSSISSQADQGMGGAGNVTINTHHLQIARGGFISSATFSPGNGGDLTVHASESITITGISPSATRNVGRSGIFVSAEPGATGNVGDLRITTPQLTVADRAEISANNRGRGRPGLATLNVGELTLLGGGEVRASSVGNQDNNFEAGRGGTLVVNANTIWLSGEGELPSESNPGIERFPSSIAALTSSSGAAGNLQITTSVLRVSDRAEVSVSGTSLRRGSLSGGAGNLNINAAQILLDNGSLTASTDTGSGAKIRLRGLDWLLMRNQSQITAAASNRADGGNIVMSAPDGFIVAINNEDNDIVASANRGNGGNVDIDALQIVGLAERPGDTPLSDVNVSSTFGTSGTIELNTLNINPAQGLAALPENVTPPIQVDQRCAVGNRSAVEERGEFVVMGRGGLPPDADESLGGDAVDVDLVTTAATETASNRLVSLPETGETDEAIVEAQGWVVAQNGDLVLTAAAPTATPDHSQRNAICAP